MRTCLILILAAAAACAAPQGAPPGDPVRVTPARGVAWPPARGEAQLVVRAFAQSPDGTLQEIAGARCTATSPLYGAEFAAPARLLLPDFGPASPPVEAVCRAGEAEGRATSVPEPFWNRGFGGWPAIGISVGTGDFDGVGVGMGWYGGGTGWSGGQPSSRYPALRVVLR
jgi:hypothetical protein